MHIKYHPKWMVTLSEYFISILRSFAKTKEIYYMCLIIAKGETSHIWTAFIIFLLLKFISG
jgi:hypothetical protein